MKKTSRKRFRFVFCNDIHFGCGDDGPGLVAAVQEMGAIKQEWDFIVCAGDLSCNGAVAELESVRKRLEDPGRPLYPLPGNHDLTGTDGAGRANYEAVYGTGRGNYLVQHKGVALLFLDLSNGTEADVEVLPSVADFLRQSLEGHPAGMPVIVFTHYPLHPGTPRFAVKNADVLFKLLDRRKVLAYFSGHYHARWQGNRNGVPFYCNSRLLSNVKNHDASLDAGYCAVDVFWDAVDVAWKNTVAQGERRQSPIHPRDRDRRSSLSGLTIPATGYCDECIFTLISHEIIYRVLLTIQECADFCHSRASGSPSNPAKFSQWIPAFAGMTSI